MRWSWTFAPSPPCLPCNFGLGGIDPSARVGSAVNWAIKFRVAELCTILSQHPDGEFFPLLRTYTTYIL